MRVEGNGEGAYVKKIPQLLYGSPVIRQITTPIW